MLSWLRRHKTGISGSFWCYWVIPHISQFPTLYYENGIIFMPLNSFRLFSSLSTLKFSPLISTRLVFQSSFCWPRHVNKIIYHFCKGLEWKVNLKMGDDWPRPPVNMTSHSEAGWRSPTPAKSNQAVSLIKSKHCGSRQKEVTLMCREISCTFVKIN